MAGFPPAEDPYHCYIKFHAPNQARFQGLSYIFELLKQEMQNKREEDKKNPDPETDEEIDRLVEEGNRRREEFTENIFVLFDDQALSHFWWPTVQENEEYWKRWKATPESQRYTDRALKHSWDFSSMVDAILQAEYALLSCRLLTEDVGVLVFLPFCWPYGSSDALKALIEAFECEIIGANVGFGYTLHKEA